MLAITMKGENAGGVSEGTLKITVEIVDESDDETLFYIASGAIQKLSEECRFAGTRTCDDKFLTSFGRQDPINCFFQLSGHIISHGWILTF